MIKKEYLITLIDLFSYQLTRVWEEINTNNLDELSDEGFLLVTKNMVKSKKDGSAFNIASIKKSIDKTKKIIDFCENHQPVITIITFEDITYPTDKFIRMPLDSRPIVLYGLGNIDLLKKESIAIIGTRESDEAYFNIGMQYSSILSDKYTIVSGLAKGCDTAAHQGAINNNGNTIAVLANGLHKMYPKENISLAEDIYAKGGLLISEYPPFSSIKRYFFAQRDRIQAALSKAVIVIQTGIKSGTMITVEYSKKYNIKLLVLEPFQDDNIYNDSGNKELLKEQDILKLPNNGISIVQFDSIISNKKNAKFTIKIKKGPNITTYILDGKEITRIPKKYKEISRNDSEVVVELIES